MALTSGNLRKKKFNIKLENGKLVAGKANLIHNHPSDPGKANMYRRNLRLDDEMQPAVEMLAEMPRILGERGSTNQRLIANILL